MLKLLPCLLTLTNLMPWWVLQTLRELQGILAHSHCHKDYLELDPPEAGTYLRTGSCRSMAPFPGCVMWATIIPLK